MRESIRERDGERDGGATECVQWSVRECTKVGEGVCNRGRARVGAGATEHKGEP